MRYKDGTALQTLSILLLSFMAFYATISSLPLIEWTEPLELVEKDRVYRPGDYVRFNTVRQSYISASAKSTKDLIQIEGSVRVERERTNKEITLEKGVGDVVGIVYEIPSDVPIPTGIYYYHGIVSYKAFGIVPKKVEWTSEQFLVEGNEKP